MGHAADETGLLTESRLCELAGIKRPRRASWAKRDLLRKRRRYAELDAAELVGFHALVKELEFDDAVLAWRQVRDEFQARFKARPLIVVFDWQRKEAELVTNVAAVAGHISHGRLSRVVDLADAVGGACRAYRRIVAESEGENASG